MFGLQLDYHEINHIYSLCGNKRTNYYIKVRDMRVRLISCLPNFNRNSAGEFVWVHGNWFAGDIPCPLSRRSGFVPISNLFDFTFMVVSFI